MGSRSDYPILVGGEWTTTAEPIDVLSPGRDGEPIGRTYHAQEEQYEQAVKAAVETFPRLRALAAYERADVLRDAGAAIEERKDELAELLALEAGKPRADALGEIVRTALTFRLAAEEGERNYGEVIPLDINAASKGKLAVTRNFPIGPVAGITPFNLPVSLAAHKVAPALAIGCPIVLKPDSATPLTMLELARILMDAGALPGSLSVLPMSLDVGDRLVTDERFGLLSFTGSAAAGWRMKARAGKKRVVLELGGNAAAIVDESADLDHAAKRCAYGAFKYAGQLCISVQRLLVHEAVWEPFMERFLERTRALRVGDVLAADTDLGPMISEEAAERAAALVGEATALGAATLSGGARDGHYFAPTVMTEVSTAARLWREEAFAPLAAVTPVASFDAALAAVNDSDYGLQAGLFTKDLQHAWKAHENLDVAGLIVNDVPTYRIDHMPYGGVKDSGFGREGLRWAIQDMTELRTMVVTV